MVFLSSILIVVTLYFLRANGLIYATIIALTGELINIFLINTLTKSIKNEGKSQTRKVAEEYRHRLDTKKKTIQELELLQQESGDKLYKASQTLKTYEDRITELEIQLGIEPTIKREVHVVEKDDPAPAPQEEQPEPKGMYDDLPPGSFKKDLPI